MVAIEICVSADDQAQMARNIRAALAAGAARIELCAQMAEGGLSPSPSAITQAKAAMQGEGELLLMIRPHSRNFCYRPPELAQMSSAIAQAAALGADGVVLGALGSARQLDLPAMAQLLAAAKSAGLKVTFHRAFDALAVELGADLEPLLAQLYSLGVARLLTSGSPWQQPLLPLAQRLEWLAALAAQVAGRFELVLAGGLTPANASQFAAIASVANTPVSLHSYSGVLDAAGNIIDANIKALHL